MAAASTSILRFTFDQREHDLRPVAGNLREAPPYHEAADSLGGAPHEDLVDSICPINACPHDALAPQAHTAFGGSLTAHHHLRLESLELHDRCPLGIGDPRPSLLGVIHQVTLNLEHGIQQAARVTVAVAMKHRVMRQDPDQGADLKAPVRRRSLGPPVGWRDRHPLVRRRCEHRVRRPPATTSPPRGPSPRSRAASFREITLKKRAYRAR